MGDLLTSAPDAVDGFSTNKEVPWMWMLLRPPRFGGAKHASVTTIGFDIAKSVFQIHGVDAAGNVIVRRQLKRRYVGVAALLMATSAAHAKKVCLGEWKPQWLMRQLVRAVLPLGRGKGTLTAVAVS
jgi:hypothetical protein